MRSAGGPPSARFILRRIALKIPLWRLHNQRIASPLRSDPADLIDWMGAVQAQEYLPAKWGLAQRLARSYGNSDLDRLVADGRILRTHVLRPTWHFVTPASITWMLELTGPRIQRGAAAYYRRDGLDARVRVRAANVFERALRDGCFLTRSELGERLARRGLRASAHQLALLTLHAELEGVICSGPPRGKQFTYALLAERAPRGRRLARDEAVAELTRRYFRSHGPATIRDFVWWSGLTTADARHGLAALGAQSHVVDGLTYWTVGQVAAGPMRRPAAHLLPIYDEYLVAYRDRIAVPHGPSTIDSRSRGAVVFQHAVIIDGHVAGTWRNRRPPKTSRNGIHTVEVFPLRDLTPAECRALTCAAERYGRFLGTPVSVSIAPS